MNDPSHYGKGDKPRPSSVPEAVRRANYDRIFKKKGRSSYAAVPKPLRSSAR
jgi:hypothetical protein